MKNFKFLSPNQLFDRFHEWSEGTVMLANRYKSNTNENGYVNNGFVYVLDEMVTSEDGTSKCKVMVYSSENNDFDTKVTFSVSYEGDNASITGYMLESGIF